MSGSKKQPPVDLLIIVMGNLGVGKSNFINVANGKKVARVDNSLEPGTDAVNKYAVRKKQPKLPGIILIDTPGFGNPHFSNDKQVLQAVLRWTEKKCQPTATFGGIIYLTTSPAKSEPFLRELGATKWISKVLKTVVVDLANKKDPPKPNNKGTMEDRLHFNNTHDSAWKIINSLASTQNLPQLSGVQDDLRVLAVGRGLLDSAAKKSRPGRTCTI